MYVFINMRVCFLHVYICVVHLRHSREYMHLFFTCATFIILPAFSFSRECECFEFLFEGDEGVRTPHSASSWPILDWRHPGVTEPDEPIRGRVGREGQDVASVLLAASPFPVRKA